MTLVPAERHGELSINGTIVWKTFRNARATSDPRISSTFKALRSNERVSDSLGEAICIDRWRATRIVRHNKTTARTDGLSRTAWISCHAMVACGDRLPCAGCCQQHFDALGKISTLRPRRLERPLPYCSARRRRRSQVLAGFCHFPVTGADRSEPSSPILRSRFYPRIDFTALRAFVLRVPALTTARLYFTEDKDGHDPTPGWVDSNSAACRLP
ncbi:hypothetical protein R69608_07287 [Paraburkholderia nemoris]|uniref:Uncharacterized protein n=1 Tax=Paraburkholderia nemoris TaxID=2793076 RepID=A0ABN7N5E8_9BURK|nr:hypothetical protein R69619_05706 [Paraburkholderia nemoris]CAE6853700.1 hypothetical protein R69776_07628 [Paraburkholderia nemoris]CAE6855294.1 hypothetical protein R75777_07752 [Paraburkholderia nemoris]CAE6874182.1 hypothetical protein R69749_06495 [Paraburkholderia domus]CAE6969858.1 hypothetical protein R69608_07287 [Paraburkholderia nemoris]